LAEWTGLDAPDSSKKEQIRRYLSVKREDLVDRAAVRTSAASANSTLLVVRPSAVGSFRAVCGQTQGGRLMLSSFACPPESGYRLEYQDGDLSDAGLARLLKGEVTANRVPRGYVRVLTHDLSVGSMAEVVIQQLVSFAAKKRFDFTLEDFCSQVFSVWRLFDVAKRRSIAKAVARVLSQLVRKRYAQRWIEKTKEVPPAWRFKINEPRDSGAFFAHMRGIAARFLAEVGGKPIQGELFDSIEDQPMAGAPPE